MDDAGPSCSPAGPAAAPGVRLPGFVDATKLFTAACDALPLGKMVHAPGFSMMDTMGAAEVMEPRTDSGMDIAPEDLPKEDRLPTEWLAHSFDAQSDAHEYTLQDVCFIMDRLLAIDVAYQSGASLSLTVYTCRWLLLNRAHLDSTPMLQALQAYLSAYARCMALIWQELVRGNVYDFEDFQGDKAGLAVLDNYCLSTESAKADLDAALANLGDDPEADAAIRPRLEVRRHTLDVIDSLSNIPRMMMRQDGLQQLSHATGSLHSSVEELFAPKGDAERRSPPCTFCATDLSAAPSARAAAAFDITIHRRLESHVPTQAKALPTPQSTHDSLIRWCRELGLVVHLLRQPGFLEWQYALSFDCNPAFGFHGELASPPPLCAPRSRDASLPHAKPSAYLRSILQSTICSSPANIVGGRHSLDWLGRTFLEELCGLTPHVIQATLMRIQSVEAQQASDETVELDTNGHATLVQGGQHARANAPMLTSEKLSWMLNQLSGHLVHYLCVLCQNGARQHRNLAKAYRTWADFSDALAEISEQVSTAVDGEAGAVLENVFACVQSVTLDIMQRITLLGFSLELLAPHERATAYWMAAFLASEKEMLLAEMAQHLHGEMHSPCRGSLEAARILARGNAAIYGALCSLTTTTGGKVPSEEMRRAQFERRYKWLASNAQPGSASPLHTLWQASQDALAAPPSTSELRKSLGEAIETFPPLAQAAERDRHPSLRKHAVDLLELGKEYDEALAARAASPPVAFTLQYTPHAWHPRISYADSSQS